MFFQKKPEKVIKKVQVYQKMVYKALNPLSANPTEWLNTLKQFVDNRRRIL